MIVQDSPHCSLGPDTVHQHQLDPRDGSGQRNVRVGCDGTEVGSTSSNNSCCKRDKKGPNIGDDNWYPDQDLLNATLCEKIGHIFLKLSDVNKAYREVAEALVEISTEVSPQHYTLLLTAAMALNIQMIVPPNMTSPIVVPPLPPPQAATPLGCTAIDDAMKLKVLPNPDAQCLHECDKNTPTRVLAAAIYAKLERKFFDSTHSRIDLATAFKCNVSQLTKALMGVEYYSGPHHYKPKTPQKQTTEEGETSGVTPAKKSKAATSTKVKLKLDEHLPEPEDTLESESSSSSDLPAGL